VDEKEFETDGSDVAKELEETLRDAKEFWGAAEPLFESLTASPPTLSDPPRRHEAPYWFDSRITEADGSDPRRAVTERQLRVVQMLAMGDSVTEVAERMRIHPERIRRWMEIPRFRRALRKERAMPMTVAQVFGHWDEEEETDAE